MSCLLTFDKLVTNQKMIKSTAEMPTVTSKRTERIAFFSLELHLHESNNWKPKLTKATLFESSFLPPVVTIIIPIAVPANINPIQSCHDRRTQFCCKHFTFSFYANQIIFRFIVDGIYIYIYKIQLISTSGGKAYSPKCSVIKTYALAAAAAFSSSFFPIIIIIVLNECGARQFAQYLCVCVCV